eukprot:Lankesteria_metandrocarpae@DN5444_c0_g3_i2.p1
MASANSLGGPRHSPPSVLSTEVAAASVDPTTTIITTNSSVISGTANSSGNLNTLVVAGPSGVGKGTLLNMIRERHSDLFEYSVSHTSRNPRPGERDGCQYYFGVKKDLLQAAAEGKFLEHALIYGNFYGTSREETARIRSAGKICLLEVDIQGVEQLLENAEFAKNAHFVFIEPPSVSALANRLKNRGTESLESQEKRVSVAVGELEAAKALKFDFRITNEALDSAFTELDTLLRKLYPCCEQD